MDASCRLCGGKVNLDYCKRCGYFFCRGCKHKYPQRVAAMMQEKGEDIVSYVLGAFGIR